ncbi:MAG: hypothetical protein WCG82_01595 [Bacteroidota bacterium]
MAQLVAPCYTGIADIGERFTYRDIYCFSEPLHYADRYDDARRKDIIVVSHESCALLIGLDIYF